MTRRVCRIICSYLALVTLLVFSTTPDFAQTRRHTGSAFGAIVAGAGLKLSSDKNAYKFNEQAAIKGKNFTPFGLTYLTVESVGANGSIDAAVGAWSVYADASGAFSTSWTVAYPGSAFKVTAVDFSTLGDVSTEFIVLSAGASLEQCRNGTFDVPVQCSGTAWVNGNLNASQAHFVEGESVPYRLLLADLTPGTQYTVTVEWDTTVSQSTHALDYLTTYNRSETDADPCTGFGACNPAVYTTAAIPTDPNVTAGHDGIPGTMDDITQVPGVFTYFGGTIDSVSGYTMTGTFEGASENSITVTFTPDAVDSVLAWGGHISTRVDWGAANSAVAINGSPFHMRLHDFNGSPGGQDRALHSDAVIFPAMVVVIVDARPHSYTAFSFALSGLEMTTMSLDDNGIESDTYQSTQTFSNILLFGTDNPIKITEDPPMHNYTLIELNCVSEPAPGMGSGTITTSIGDRQALLTLAEAETVTCTFVNASPTSARIDVGGTVRDASGRPLSNVVVTAVSIATGEVVAARTNMFGRYRLSGLEAGSDYVISPRSARHRFEPGAALLHVTETEGGLNFTAVPSP